MDANDVINYKDRLIHSVQKCIQFKSVKNQTTVSPDAPFGTGIRDCLEWALKLGAELGFRTRNIDGYAGHIEMGNGPLLGILGHLDVVPEGDGWTVNPYEGIIKDGKIYGRGALDDKGPLLASLYAMKAIKDAGIPLKRTIRLILGTDEESGWADMEYYKQVEKIPIEGFSPDAQFPVINAEKGTLHIELSKRLSKLKHLSAIAGGIRANVVPDLCTIDVKDIPTTLIEKAISEIPFESGVSVRIKSLTDNTMDSCKITVRGVSAHGSTPELGKNAVIYAMHVLSSLPLTPEEKEVIEWIYTYPANGLNGEGFGIELFDEPSGKLTTNIGILELNEDLMRLVIDVRFPVTFSKKEVLSSIENISLKNGFDLKLLTEHAPHYVPKENELVQSLLRAYSDITGLEPYAFGIGGGTYAKLLPQGVAFGPCIPGEPEHIHCPDEFITIENLVLASRIYTQAILNLAIG